MRSVLITGGGGGLGFELVKEHVKTGDQIFALDVNLSENLMKLASENKETLFPILCDIGSTESVNAALEKVKKHTQHLDRIFNNAGIHRFEDWVTLDETDLDFCQVMFNVNAVGPLRIVKAALDLIDAETVIINTSSEAASLTDQSGVILYDYCMSKAGMNMGARIMDNWLKEKCGTRTIMIHPGRMKTAMKGAHSEIDPWETSGALMKLLDRLDEIPEDQLFMDYKGNRFNW